MKHLVVTIFLLILVGCQNHNVNTQSSNSLILQDWQLDTENSLLTFLSTKNKSHTEEHKLQFKAGSITGNQFKAVIDLDSVDTMIPIRDERMRNILFNTKDFPVASIQSTLPNDLELEFKAEVVFELDLHGYTKTMSAVVMTQLVENQLVVVNYEPIAINTKDFGMDDGINQLTTIAGLQSIDYTALVDFKLTFEK